MGQQTEKSILMLFDVGNTAIKLGFADRAGLRASYALPADSGETSDGLGIKLIALCKHAGIAINRLEACALTSVKPSLDPLLKSAIENYMRCPALFVPHDLPVPLHNNYPQAEKTGSDRLVAAYAARLLFPCIRSLLIVDFGTAITFDCVRDVEFLGGLIFPGPGITLSSLAQKTAKLPLVTLDVSFNEPQINVDSATSIQHGLVLGYKYLVEGLCGKLKEQLPEPVKTVATGKFAETLAKTSHIFDAVVPFLVLDGLRNLYYIQKQDYAASNNANA